MTLKKRLVLTILMNVMMISTQGHELAGMRQALFSHEPSQHHKCTRQGNFTSRRGYPIAIGVLTLVNIFGSGNIEACHDLCRQCCMCTVQVIFSLANNTFACLSLRGQVEIQEDPTSDVEIYTFSAKHSTPHQSEPPALAPSDAILDPIPTDSPAFPPMIKSAKGKHLWRIWLLVLGAVLSAFTLCSVAILCYSLIKSDETSRGIDGLTEEITSSSSINKFKKRKKLGVEMQLFRFKSICIATNQFSASTKIGEGGFGLVYKGVLADGQQVAVKRLSTSSSQGMVEFKNEIKLIAKLQHTNLVRLLGCCIERSEKILVYEFLANKSLDSFLFDPVKKKLLGWKKRLEIIGGTAQGLLYLHKYSRLKVIHRDLKTSNILLDSNLNPKISDFGLARIFQQNTSSANTSRIVGTYGYMSPEYAMEGLYSEKSDVFSFGVIVLEIISGRKATSFSGIEHPLNLIRYSWDMWREGKSLEIIDGTIGEAGTCSKEELARHIQVGLLCVEERASERPGMSEVVSMLTNITMPLPAPKQPAFCCGKSKRDQTVCESEPTTCSPNLVTLSPIGGR